MFEQQTVPPRVRRAEARAMNCGLGDWIATAVGSRGGSRPTLDRPVRALPLTPPGPAHDRAREAGGHPSVRDSQSGGGAFRFELEREPRVYRGARESQSGSDAFRFELEREPRVYRGVRTILGESDRLQMPVQAIPEVPIARRSIALGAGGGEQALQPPSTVVARRPCRTPSYRASTECPRSMRDRERRPNRTQCYMVSPHSNENNFFANALGMNLHRFSKSKSPVQPIFKDETQRKRFHHRVERELRNAHAERREVLEFLFDHSRPQRKQTLMDFTETQDAARATGPGAEPTHRVYVQGHGFPGKHYIVSDAGSIATAEEVADLLTRMSLPPDADVRPNSCWSGAGREYVASNPDWLRRFRSGTLDEVCEPELSFSAGLLHHLRRRGFKGPVYGYLTETFQFPQDAYTRQDEFARHMAGYPTERRRATGADWRPYAVRKSDIRIAQPASGLGRRQMPWVSPPAWI